MAAILYRAKESGAVSEWQSRRLWEQISKAGYRTREPVVLPPEEPHVVKDIIDAHRKELGFSERDFENLVHLRWDEFKTVYPVDTDDPPRLRVVF